MAAAALLAAHGARADEAGTRAKASPELAGSSATGSATVWTCWLGTAHQSLACLLTDAAPPDAVPDPATQARQEARLDPRLPPQVRSMRLTPQAWQARTVFIPLHGTAFVDSDLRGLAQAVMCGHASDCRAVMNTDPVLAEPRFIALLADANDPLLTQ